MKYKLLNQQHADYDRGFLCRLDYLFQGGKELMSHANLFLPQLPEENPRVYQARLNSVSYTNYFSAIINDYNSHLFSKQLSVVPTADADDEETAGELPEADEFYEEFSKDADLARNSFAQVLSCIFEDSLIYGRSYLGVDFPKDMPPNLQEREMEEISLADEDAFGLSRAYVYEVPVYNVINWQKDDYGQFQWLMLRSEEIDNQPLEEQKNKTITFKLWKRDNGVVSWQKYQIVVRLGTEPRPNDEVDLVDQGTVSFLQIPILELCIPDGLWIGNVIYPTLCELFKLQSSLMFAETRALFEVPFYQISSELDNIGNPVGEDSNRGRRFKADLENKGFIVGSDKDKLSFVGPEGKVFEIMHKQMQDKVDEMYRSVHQMSKSIRSTATGISRSGISKIMDDKAQEMILTEYATVVKDFAKEVYTVISEARKEDVYWQCLGMDNYKVIDPEQLLTKAQALSQLNVPSSTWKKHLYTSTALDLIPNVEPKVQLAIQQEINEAIDAQGVQSLPTDAISNQDPKTNNPKSNPGYDNPGNLGNPDSETPDSIPVGEDGHLQGYDGMHLQSGEHIDSQVVYDQLAEDYDEKDIQFVLSIPWRGPISVPLASVDDSNKENWSAAEDEDHIQEFMDKIQGGWSKPIILVNSPANNQKMSILDGHHRFIAYQRLGMPVPAYVGDIGKLTDEMKKMHSRQAGGSSKQMSMQSNQVESVQSVQKQVSRQANKSAEARNGKTK